MNCIGVDALRLVALDRLCAPVAAECTPNMATPDVRPVVGGLGGARHCVVAGSASRVPTDGQQIAEFLQVLKITRSGDNEPEPQRYLQLIHGHITHGLQFVEPPRATADHLLQRKAAWAAPLQSLPGGEHHIGLVGLGIGTLAAYAQPGVASAPMKSTLKCCGWPPRDYFFSNCLAKSTRAGRRPPLHGAEPPQNFDLRWMPSAAMPFPCIC